MLSASELAYLATKGVGVVLPLRPHVAGCVERDAIPVAGDPERPDFRFAVLIGEAYLSAS